MQNPGTWLTLINDTSVRRDEDVLVKEEPGRLRRERRTMASMVALACRDLHGGGDGLCPECAELVAYAERRIGICPFGDDKPTCASCPIHCYRPGPRERMREVMRYAGPRMIWRHPLLALWHLIDSRFHRHTIPPPRRPAGPQET